ncbi:hypothetical protein ACLK1S_05015 [Escherichia coli]
MIDKSAHSVDGIMKPVTSGFGFIDRIIPAQHKANGYFVVTETLGFVTQNVKDWRQR